MANVAVVFESRYGQAEKIAEHIADLARKKGHDARTIRASLATYQRVTAAGGVVVVAPVYFGRHPVEIERFLRTYGGLIAERPCAFVSVSNSAASAEAKYRAEALRIAHRTVDGAVLRPHAVVSIGGALAYPRYGFFIRAMMRFIAKRGGYPTSTAKVHELTDWVALDAGLAPFFAASSLEVEEPVGHDAGVSGIQRIPTAPYAEPAMR